MQNPELAASPLGWAIKEHNAKCVHIANGMKRDIANENIRLVKKLLHLYSSKPDIETPASSVADHAPPPIPNVAGEDAPSFELDTDGNDEASTPIKKDGKAEPISPTSATKIYSDNLVGQLMMLNDEIGDTEGYTVFGQVNDTDITKKNVTHTGFPKDPWSTNQLVRTHGPTIRKAIRDWMWSRTPSDLSREWVSHPDPRIISISGKAIKSQICDGYEIDHELGSLVIRRMGQMEAHAHRATLNEQYRLLLEPDFSCHAIAGEDTTRIMSIQIQFTGIGVKCNIANCRMVTVPADMQHGWCCFNWDMVDKVITIMDPMAYQTEDAYRKTSLIYAADKLHDALFDCIEDFFTKWHYSWMFWRKKTPCCQPQHSPGLRVPSVSSIYSDILKGPHWQNHLLRQLLPLKGTHSSSR
ncbi:uncharacterized protein LOC119356459 isoform X1 [Triticum dicoccoides]|uniref:uncharacterized protein LOC119356459 isoform X1 n=1 Tax=Triticum dicoccoides TaxID=85692 RepID=UPI0018907F14|nr:uncharacterized protein LOC119356459 isoform X1 [Triticum dicoccoides]